MPFTSKDFHDQLDTDLWVIEQILTLPSDPEPTITHQGAILHVDIEDTVAMPQMQAAITEYRRRILPVIFIVSQKVYTEFFRLVLDQCGRSAGKRQVDIERSLAPLVTGGSVTMFHPFPDAATFQNWWSGRYCYTTLRDARNQVAHNKYVFAGGILKVTDDTGRLLLDWTEADILSFADGVLGLSKKV